MKLKLLLFLIIILSFTLRFWKVGRIPNGFYSDEASFGYNAYSILKTGKDEYGAFLPVSLKSFGDYKASLYAYYLVPFIAVGGLNETSIRLGSVVLGVAIVLLSYSLSYEILKRRRISLLTSFVLSVSPLMIQFQRMQHENNLSFFLMLLGIYFFLKAVYKPVHLFSAVFLFSLSIYSYHDAKILAPIILLVLVVFNYKRLLVNFKILTISFVIGLVTILPYVTSLKSESSLSRPKNVVVFSDIGIVSQIDQNRQEAYKVNAPLSDLFFNKPLSFSLKFISNYLSHFSPEFLFERGDLVKIYSTPNSGILYPYEIITLIIGSIILVLNYKKRSRLIFILLCISPLAASLTKFVPSSSRLLFIAFPLSVITAVGFSYFSKYIKPWILACICIVIIFFQARFLYSYFVISPVRYAKEWHYGVKDIMQYVSLHENNYSTIWFSRKVWGYSYPLFYLKYEPKKYQLADHLGPLNEYGFGWVREFDKYVLDDFPPDMRLRKDILFIGEPDEFRSDIVPQKIIYYPDGSKAFYIANYESF